MRGRLDALPMGSEVDISQRVILNKLAEYCDSQNRDPELSKQLRGDGYCSGFTSLVLHGLWLETRPIRYQKGKPIPRDDWTWIKGMLQQIASTPVSQIPRVIPASEMERFLGLLEYFQKIREYRNIGQGELQSSFEAVSTFEDKKPEIQHIRKGFSIAGLFSQEDLQKQIDGTAMIDAIASEGQGILCGSHNHDTGLFKYNENYYYYDPNCRTGVIKLSISQKKELASALFKANFILKNVPAPLGFREFIFEDKVAEVKHIAVEKILAQTTFVESGVINPDLSFAKQRKPVIEAAWVGSVDSLKFYVNRYGKQIVNQKDESGLAALHFAAMQGHLDFLKELASNDQLDINAVSSNGSTALFDAARYGHITVLEFLLERKASIEKVNTQGQSVLHYAAEYSHAEMIEFLSKIRKVNLNAKNNWKQTPLIVAAKNGNLATVQALITAKASINLKDNNGETALYHAAEQGHVSIVNFLLEQKKIDFTSKDEYGVTPLDEAIKGKHVLVVVALLNKGMSISRIEKKLDTKDKHDNTLLHAAAKSGYHKLVCDLLKKQLDINAQNDEGNTPLHLAMQSGHFDIMLELLKSGANVNIKNKEGLTPLHLAVKYGQAEWIDYLVDEKANLDVVDNNGLTALHLAAKQGKSFWVEKLLSYQRAVSITESPQAAPLNFAGIQRRLSEVKLIFDSKRDINLEDKNGLTPMLHALNNGSAETVSALLKAGVDLNQINKAGESYLYVAIKSGNLNVIKVLLEHKIDVNTVIPPHSQTPLLIASAYGHADVVVALLAAHADAKQTDTEKRTCLHLAVASGHLNVVDLLLEKKVVDVNEPDITGSSPLFYIVKTGNLKIVERMLEEKTLMINARDSNGCTLIYYAAMYGRADILERVLKKGGDINLLPSNGSSLLSMAVRKGKADAVKLLIENKCMLNEVDQAKASLLHLAQELQVVRVLLDSKIDVNVRDQFQDTPLIYAGRDNNLGKIQYLLEAKADLSLANTDGVTLLHIAAASNNLSLVTLLLNHPDIHLILNAKDKKGLTPLDCALKNNQGSLVELLMSKNAVAMQESFTNFNFLWILTQAVYKGHLNVVKDVLEKKAAINAKDQNGMTPLQYAVSNGQVEIMRFLIEQKADVNEKSMQGVPAMHYVRHKEVLKILMESQADINAKDTFDLTLLHKASQSGNVALVSELLEQKSIQVDVVDKANQTPLFCAAQQGHADAVDLLLKRQANKNALNARGCAPILIAAIHDNFDVISVLLKSNVDVNFKSSKEFTPLHAAAENGHAEIVMDLLEKKADFDAKTIEHMIPLHLAAQHGHLFIAKTLIEKNPKAVNTPNYAGNIALHLAAANDDIKLGQLLLEKKSSLNQKNKAGETPLHAAAAKGAIKMAEGLIKAEVKVNEKDANGLTALHKAAQHGQLDMVALLIKHKADVNSKNNADLTPLHLAVTAGRENMIKNLLKANAQISLKDKDNSNVFHLAVLQGQSTSIKTLIDYCKESKKQFIEMINAKNANGLTPVHLAAKYGQPGILQSLVNDGANILAVDEYGNNSLHLAVQQNNYPVISFLLQSNQFDVNQQSSAGLTPFHMACDRGALSTMSMLLENKADINATTKNGKTPLQLAEESKNKNVCAFLQFRDIPQESVLELKTLLELIVNLYGGRPENKALKEILSDQIKYLADAKISNSVKFYETANILGMEIKSALSSVPLRPGQTPVGNDCASALNLVLQDKINEFARLPLVLPVGEFKPADEFLTQARGLKSGGIVRQNVLR